MDCILNTHVWGRKRQKKGGKLEGKEEMKEQRNEGMKEVTGVIVMGILKHCQKVSDVHWWLFFP